MTDSLEASRQIETVRRDSGTVAVPVLAGDTVSVRGRVSAGTDVLPDSSLIFLEDETAGIGVKLPEAADVTRGDSLWVRGVVDHRFGLTRLNALEHQQIGSLSREVSPISLTVASAVGERYEGRLVRVRGEVVVNRQNQGGRYLLLEDPVERATNRVAVFVPSHRMQAVDLQPYRPGDHVVITGVLSQHDRSEPFRNAYQVLPRDQDDLEAGNGVPGGYQTVILFIIGGALLAVVVVLTLRAMIRRRTQQLAESRARFRRLAEATAEGIILHKDGEMVDVNRALTAMLGYSREELVGRSFASFFSDSTRDLQTDANSAGDDAHYETVVVRKDGSSFPAEVEERTVDGEEGRVRVVAVRNITDRRRRETELLLAKEEAEQMARLKSSLLNNMSHEFRTPVTSILGYADLILEEPNADHRPFAAHIRDSARRLSRTLRAVLEMAQLEADTLEVRPENVDVASLVRRVAQGHRTQAEEKGVEVRVSAPSGCVLQTDRELLRRVLDNILHNAVKFTENGVVEVEVVPNDPELKVHVTDTGKGIDADFRGELFEPFKQESEGRTRTHEGTGLGLALSKRMTDLLDGSIQVESTKGEGSRFTVNLSPITEAYDVPTSPQEHPSSA